MVVVVALPMAGGNCGALTITKAGRRARSL